MASGNPELELNSRVSHRLVVRPSEGWADFYLNPVLPTLKPERDEEGFPIRSTEIRNVRR